MANLYRDTAAAAAPTPALAGERHADVVVVGGGFTGLSTALHAAERGLSVVVLEARDPGWGASGRNGGQVNPGLKHDPSVVRRDFGAERAERMLRFAGNAPEFVFELLRRLKLECAATRCGTLRAAVHPKHLAKVRMSAGQQLELGAPVEYLEREAVAAATGTDRYSGALLDRRGGALNPLSFARGLARAAAAAGAVVCGDSRALAIEKSGRRVARAHGRGQCRRQLRRVGHERVHGRALAGTPAQRRAGIRRDRGDGTARRRPRRIDPAGATGAL